MAVAKFYLGRFCRNCVLNLLVICSNFASFHICNCEFTNSISYIGVGLSVIYIHTRLDIPTISLSFVVATD